MDGELADDGLAGAGGCRHQHALAGLQRLARLDLEGVEAEVVHLAEGRERGGLLAARLRAAAYRSAGERSSVIVLSSVPGRTDNRTIIIRIGARGAPDRAAGRAVREGVTSRRRTR
ncbi:hypothetical protein SFUMM280S_09114 [Streptomyces fumanus]